MLFTGSGLSCKHLCKRFTKVRRDIYVSHVRRRRSRNDHSIQLIQMRPKIVDIREGTHLANDIGMRL